MIRMRAASDPINLCAMDGTSSSTLMNRRWSMTSKVQSVAHVTDAVRGPWSSSESSPTTSPSLSVAICRLLRLIVTSPLRMIKASRLISPWSMTIEPAGMVISLAAFATFSKSLLLHALNRGTFLRLLRLAAHALGEI